MRNTLGGFLLGFSSYIRVLSLFGKLGLWKYLLITIVVSLGLVLLLILIAVLLASQLPLGSIYYNLLFALAFLALGLLLFKHLVLIAASPWMGGIAQGISQHFAELDRDGAEPSIGATKAKERVQTETQGLWQRSFRLNARLFGFELLLTIPLLILGVIPLTALPAGIMLLAVQSYFIGAGALDFSLEHAGYDHQRSLEFFRQHRGLAAGTGLGFMLLLFTAVGFLFAPAWSAAAAAYSFEKQVRDRADTTG